MDPRRNLGSGNPVGVVPTLSSLSASIAPRRLPRLSLLQFELSFLLCSFQLPILFNHLLSIGLDIFHDLLPFHLLQISLLFFHWLLELIFTSAKAFFLVRFSLFFSDSITFCLRFSHLLLLYGHSSRPDPGLALASYRGCWESYSGAWTNWLAWHQLTSLRLHSS